MRKYSDNGPALSFFAFQDIITCVTGIMFLVVILVILLIFDQKPAKSSDGPKQSASAVQTTLDIKQLAKQIESLRKNMKTSQDWLKINSVEAERLMKLDFQAIEAEIASLQKKNVKIEETVDIIQRETARSSLLRQEIQSEEIEAESKLKDITKQNELNDKEVAKLKAVERQLQEEVAKQKRILVSYDRSESKTPIFVECGKHGIRAKPLDTNDIKDFRTINTIYTTTPPSINSWNGQARRTHLPIILSFSRLLQHLAI